MSSTDISAIVYTYDEDGSLGVSNPYSIPVNMTTQAKKGRGLSGLLTRIEQDLSKQDRTPKNTLKQSHHYREVNGCPNKKELKKALKICNLSQREAEMVHQNFPNEYGGIDFKMLTHRIFATECDRRKYINLRQEQLIPSQFPGYQQQAAPAASPAATATLRSTGRFGSTGQMSPQTQGVGQAQAF